MNGKMTQNRSLHLILPVWVFCVLGCTSAQKSERETMRSPHTEATEMVTAQWPDGTTRRKVEVVKGDTVSISLFDSDGNLKKYGEWKDSKQHGVSESFYPNGLPWSKHTYDSGIQVGPYQTWYPNGNPFIIGQYDNQGKPDGTWQFFDESGTLIQEQPGDSIAP